KASSPCRNHSQQMKRLEVLGIGVEHEPAKTLCLNQLSALKKCDGVAHRLCDSERSCARRRALPGLGIWGKHVQQGRRRRPSMRVTFRSIAGSLPRENYGGRVEDS